jgi:cation diffusion facilitator CzcD-associated flavoprotein CzcO
VTETLIKPDHEIAVIGAGFSGIGAAIKLAEAGFEDFVVLDEADGVGGAWHWNTYPGVAVDIPSFSYSFSFETSPRWSRVYAPGAELKEYAEDLVDRYDVRSRLRLRTKIVGAEFDDASHFWRLRVDGGGEIKARHVIGATGVFTQPKTPELPGLDSFRGPVMHTARWDHAEDLSGLRVAVIGTGASAIQVIPALAPELEQLVVFQRTPIWCLPKPDAPMIGPVRALLKLLPIARLPVRAASQAFVELSFVIAAQYHGLLPVAGAGERLARDFIRRQVDDPEVRDKLTPRYGLGCKRPAFSNDYLRTFNRDNVLLETDAIAAITPTGIRTVAGAEHPLDAIVMATGFKVFETGNVPPFPIRGAGGIDLDAFWDENRFQAYQGVSVPGFPNFFSILGPYGYNGSSYFQLIETQMRHIVRCLKRARRTDATLVEIRPEANDRYFAEMLARRRHQVFWRDTCSTANSYYFDKHGDVPFRAATSLEVTWRSARFDLDDYRFAAAA